MLLSTGQLDLRLLLGLKKNQPNLFRDVQEMFDDALRRPIESTTLDLAKTEDQRHGRVEHRRCWVLPPNPAGHSKLNTYDKNAHTSGGGQELP